MDDTWHQLYGECDRPQHRVAVGRPLADTADRRKELWKDRRLRYESYRRES